MTDKLFFNKTFNIGNNTHLNACVGNNGIQDHYKYGYGYDEAVSLLILASENTATIDAIIYPLVFCARHRIELFLKDQLLKLLEIRENKTITEDLLTSTHDLKKLWGLFKTQGTSTDRRIIDFTKKAEEYIIDFSEIDLTGETFRYPYTKFKTLHLLNTPIINIAIFKKRFSEISTFMKIFESLTEFLIYEYEQNTFTKKLSRNDIFDISNILPLKEKWTLDSFDKIKLQIKKKYDLGSKELSKAINIIKAHREFCINIGTELPLEQINIKNMNLYISIYNEYKAIDCNKEEAFVERVRLELPKQAIICIYTLVELGKLDYFSEAFDLLYNKYDCKVKDECDLYKYCSYIIRKGKALDHIKNALRNMGQISLLRSFFNE